MWEYRRSSVVEFAAELWNAQAKKVDPNPAIPLPEGGRITITGKASASGCFGKNFFDPKHFL